ncbi:TPA_asm: hypothetical protein G1W88_25320 [Salmonella enterica subsp. enterica serovar Typhimurium str. SL1344]|nr:hypothetical protein [Salmonella enterica subsp. enterica serovar Derby]HAD6667390.1 hypothetical protein [Salmonella enterica subsp. enterica serovar Typhimurium str. SL1344]
MKNILMAVFIITTGYVGVASAEDVKTIKYFSSHIEEAKAMAKDCDVKAVECKNAKYVAWEANHKPKKATETKPKSEPVKK